MLERLRGVLSFKTDTFNEIEHDPSALSQALLIVVVSSILTALGGGFGEVMFGVGIGSSSSGTSVFKFVSIAIWAIVAWLLWSVITQFIGTRFFDGEATVGEMMRVIGFAYAPLAIQIFAFIPVFGGFLRLGAAAWSVGLVYVAILEGLDIGPGSAFLTALIGGFVYLVGMGVILTIF